MAYTEDNSKAKKYGPYEFALGDELRGERATLGRTLLDVQRDLRIKAEHIAAIENADPSAFPNPGFISGYVRSYARYLQLDPDEVYWRFCQETGFSSATAKPAAPISKKSAVASRAAVPLSGTFRPDFPMASPLRAGLPPIPFAAIGSLFVLVGLVCGLAYGGWTVLQNIQRVHFAPVDELPVAVAEVDPLSVPAPQDFENLILSELASPVAATALSELYRQQELEVPILVPRDGPIASIDPDRMGLITRNMIARDQGILVEDPRVQAGAADASSEMQVVAAEEQPLIAVIAERAAWIRVYLEDGTVLFERILERGETYSPPADVVGAMIWAGNSGSVYVRVGEDLHGPLGTGTRAVRDIVLQPDAIVERFAVVEEIPESISDTVGSVTQQVAVTLQ